MFVTRSAGGVLVWAPAKLNLYFEVLGNRGDGFHEVETLLVPVALWDRLELFPLSQGALEIDCRWVRGFDQPPGQLGELPPARENLVTKALELLRARSGGLVGARVVLRKQIPSAAGLGGGSSDAAAALVAANLAWGLNWPRNRLAELAAQLGSDVPFFLLEGAAIGRGRGERLEPVASLGTLHAVVVRPSDGLATADVYRAVADAHHPQSPQPAVQALAARDWKGIGRALHNRLEAAAAALSPWPARLKQEFAAAGCTVAQLTGSGSAYFGLVRHARQARQLAGRLRARGYWTQAVRSLAGAN